jgi:hypothetical protein
VIRKPRSRGNGAMARMLAKAVVVALLSALAATPAHSAAKKKQERAAPAPPLDKRDRVVAAPGTPFHGRAYWSALAQCGGIYFKLASFHSDAAIRAKLGKPDPPAQAQATRRADEASKAATWFFDAAERVLIADRKVAREDAVVIYDPQASEAGDRLKSVEAAVQAMRPCPALYQACHGAHPVVCRENQALAPAS